MSIQRYAGIEVHEATDGDMIAYEDHVAAIEHLERVHRNEINEIRWFNQVTREDSFIAGFREAIEECISIAKNENFILEDGRYVWAAAALLNVIKKIGALDAYSYYGK